MRIAVDAMGGDFAPREVVRGAIDYAGVRPGDEVILIKLAAGMEEAAHTRTDSQGEFSLSLSGDDENAPHLVRVIHQGVTYHQPAPPGTQSVDVKVFDAAKKVEGVNAVADLMYLQAGKGDGVSDRFPHDRLFESRERVGIVVVDRRPPVVPDADGGEFIRA